MVRDIAVMAVIAIVLLSLPARPRKACAGAHCGCRPNAGQICEMPCTTCCAPGPCDCSFPNPGRR